VTHPAVENAKQATRIRPMQSHPDSFLSSTFSDSVEERNFLFAFCERSFTNFEQ
jgi:hypothetical protein